MTKDNALEYLRKKAEEAKGPWTPYSYGAWAAAVEAMAEEFLEHQDDEEIQDALILIADRIKRQIRAITDGGTRPDSDSDLVILRESMDAPRTHFWLWPERL